MVYLEQDRELIEHWPRFVGHQGVGVRVVIRPILAWLVGALEKDTLEFVILDDFHDEVSELDDIEAAFLTIACLQML